MNYCFAGQG